MIHAGVDGQLYFNSWCANRISNVFGARLRCVDLISGYDYEMPKKQVARGCEVQKFEFQSRLEASPHLDFPLRTAGFSVDQVSNSLSKHFIQSFLLRGNEG